MNPEISSAAELTALLGTDADIQLKARACRQLALTGSAESVPALAELLGDPKLADHARTALENIPSPAAAEALRAAFGKLIGNQRAGVANSLAVLRDTAAVPALVPLAKTPDSGALAALGQIADTASLAEIRAQLAGPSPVPAAHAALGAAQALLHEGAKETALPLLDAIAAAKVPAYLSDAARELRWHAHAVSLFDGNSLEGWQGDLTWFRTYDRSIIAGSMDKPIPRNEFLVFRQDFADFELRLQVRLIGGKGNGGIQFRSQRIEDSHEMIGYQADIAPEHWGGLYDESRRNRFLGTRCQADALAAILRPDGWNDYRIRCEGPVIRLWLNGLLTTEFTETDAAIPHSGKIGLQVHSGAPTEVCYRNILLLALDS